MEFLYVKQFNLNFWILFSCKNFFETIVFLKKSVKGHIPQKIRTIYSKQYISNCTSEKRTKSYVSRTYNNHVGSIKLKKYMLFASREVRIGKNYAEAVGWGRYSTQRAQFFPVRTDLGWWITFLSFFFLTYQNSFQRNPNDLGL